MATYGIYDAILGSSLTLKQCESADFAFGHQVRSLRASGAVDPSGHAVNSAEPKATWRTTDLAGLFGTVSPRHGYAINGSVIALQCQRRQPGSTFASGAAHFSITAQYGLVVPGTISGPQEGDATAEVMCYVRGNDSMAKPFSQNSGVSLASQSTTIVTYALGPARITDGNGQVYPIKELRSVTINPGITVRVKRDGGGPYPTTLDITLREPTMDLQFDDLDTAAQLDSLSCGGAMEVWFRKRDCVGFISPSTADHIKFSFADGVNSTEQISGSGTDDAAATVRCYGNILTATTATTIG